MKKIAIIIIVFLLPFAALAKPRVKIIKKKDRIVYKKNTIINFSERTVDGELIKPKGGFIQSRGRAKFNSLIKYRKDFVDNMLKRARKL
tara:strand:- start:126 stop:392 length:267 start_codon:yes stop_codon:yes gene_type:complete